MAEAKAGLALMLGAQVGGWWRREVRPDYRKTSEALHRTAVPQRRQVVQESREAAIGEQIVRRHWLTSGGSMTRQKNSISAIASGLVK